MGPGLDENTFLKSGLKKKLRTISWAGKLKISAAARRRKKKSKKAVGWATGVSQHLVRSGVKGREKNCLLGIMPKVSRQVRSAF